MDTMPFGKWLRNPFAKRARAGLAILLAGFSPYAWSKGTPGWVEWRGLGNRNPLLSCRPVPEGNSVEEKYIPGLDSSV